MTTTTLPTPLYHPKRLYLTACFPPMLPPWKIITPEKSKESRSGSSQATVSVQNVLLDLPEFFFRKSPGVHDARWPMEVSLLEVVRSLTEEAADQFTRIYIYIYSLSHLQSDPSPSRPARIPPPRAPAAVLQEAVGARGGQAGLRVHPPPRPWGLTPPPLPRPLDLNPPPPTMCQPHPPHPTLCAPSGGPPGWSPVAQCPPLP